MEVQLKQQRNAVNGHFYYAVILHNPQSEKRTTTMLRHFYGGHKSKIKAINYALEVSETTNAKIKIIGSL